MPELDVAIIGGGPGGSTTGALLKLYNPALKIGIYEREVFPRDHIGESQLPPIGFILQEMGVWDRVERAGFPIKLGATYTWGKTTEPWVFGFLPDSDIPAKPERPGKYEGWRVSMAFQVDRSIYDKILLDRAQELGCDVRQGTKVAEIERTGDRVDGIRLESGERITARYYVDASGNAAILRKAMGVKVEVPTLLKNVAFWDYWTKKEWLTDGEEDATRIHIRSLPFGWVWFIRIGHGRASVGVVCNAEYYKQSGMRPEELYTEAMTTNPYVAKSIAGGTRRGHLDATNDWSYVVERTYGENWFLVGEVAGFADPILSAGMAITQAGARELAYSILELDRGQHDRAWLLGRYDELQKRRVRQHMRFAEFWYSANGLFVAVRENCAKIASDAGLKLTADDAFRWLSFGGLADDVPGQAGLGGLDLSGVKHIVSRFTGRKITWLVNGKNTFRLNLAGATESSIGTLDKGRITRVPCWTRGDRRLIAAGMQAKLIDALRASSDIREIFKHIASASGGGSGRVSEGNWDQVTVVNLLESMAADFWVTCERKGNRPALDVTTPEDGLITFTDRTGKYE